MIESTAKMAITARIFSLRASLSESMKLGITGWGFSLTPKLKNLWLISNRIEEFSCHQKAKLNFGWPERYSNYNYLQGLSSVEVAFVAHNSGLKIFECQIRLVAWTYVDLCLQLVEYACGSFLLLKDIKAGRKLGLLVKKIPENDMTCQ